MAPAREGRGGAGGCSCPPGAGRRWGSKRSLSGWIIFVMESIQTKVLGMSITGLLGAGFAVRARIGIASGVTVPGETGSRQGWGPSARASGGLRAGAELAGNPRARRADVLLFLSAPSMAFNSIPLFFRKMMEGKAATMNKKQRFSKKES